MTHCSLYSCSMNEIQHERNYIHIEDTIGRRAADDWSRRHQMVRSAGRCAHCGEQYRAGIDGPENLCDDCGDIAVWGGACDYCEETPSGREIRICEG